jgi:hypothetical protein
VPAHLTQRLGWSLRCVYYLTTLYLYRCLVRGRPRGTTEYYGEFWLEKGIVDNTEYISVRSTPYSISSSGYLAGKTLASSERKRL